MTTSPLQEENLSTAPSNSDEPLIEIHLFHCGHGDTILVRLPSGQWGLIDCYLPQQYGIRDQFFRYIETLKIKTLDFIIQTHPDYDHYHGMSEVIEYFHGRGEKIGYYIDTGVNTIQIRALLSNQLGLAEYRALQEKLEQWERDDLLKWRELDAERVPFIPKGCPGQVALIPIGPDPGSKRQILRGELRKSATSSSLRPEANRLSLVVVLSAKIDERSLNVLLTADADIEGIASALDHWNKHAQEKRLTSEFDVIKIPHHGSIKSHHPRLCQMKRAAEPATAAVSAGTRKALPDREVLRDYLQNRWNVMSTTVRVAKPKSSLPLTLADRGRPEIEAVQGHTIRFSWTPQSGLIANPENARIVESNLARYETARS